MLAGYEDHLHHFTVQNVGIPVLPSLMLTMFMAIICFRTCENLPHVCKNCKVLCCVVIWDFGGQRMHNL